MRVIKGLLCCLSSLNLDTYDHWKDDPQFVDRRDEIFRYVIMTDFVNRAPNEFAHAKYSAMRREVLV